MPGHRRVARFADFVGRGSRVLETGQAMFMFIFVRSYVQTGTRLQFRLASSRRNAHGAFAAAVGGNDQADRANSDMALKYI